MDVGGTTIVVLGKVGDHLDDAVIVCFLDSTECGAIDIGRCAFARDARVDAGGVGMPAMCKTMYRR